MDWIPKSNHKLTAAWGTSPVEKSQKVWCHTPREAMTDTADGEDNIWYQHTSMPISEVDHKDALCKTAVSSKAEDINSWTCS